VLFQDISPDRSTAEVASDDDLGTLVYRVYSDVELPASPGGSDEGSQALWTCRSREPPFHMFRRAVLTITTAVYLPEN
jgi:hypothetical protein